MRLDDGVERGNMQNASNELFKCYYLTMIRPDKLSAIL
jgi:hypothetical protein